jgi:hypothetical protein
MYMKRSAQLSQLKACYQRVWDHLSSGAMEGALTSTEVTYPECVSYLLLLTWVDLHLIDPNSILRAPRKLNFKPDVDMQRRLSQYLALIYACETKGIKAILPETMTQWGKVRIANGGDKIRAACAVSQAQAETTRNSSFVRVRDFFLF